MNVAANALAQDSRLTTIVSTWVGQEIEGYRIEKLIGAGGMGEVYLARDLKLGRMVALKVLPLHFVVDTDRLSRFQREARALSSLNHPNLVTIYEVGEAQGLHFIAMELVEGKALSSLRGKLSLKELLSIVAQVAEALGAAHQSGIIHRDVKPDNVMVRPDGYAKVLDFGDGMQWRDVTNDKFFDRYPRWSPDGKRIAFTRIAVVVMRSGYWMLMRRTFANSLSTVPATRPSRSGLLTES